MCSRRCAERSSLCIKSSSSAALKSHAFRRLTQLHHKACYCEVTLKILPIEQLVPYAEHVGSRLLRGYAVCIVAKPTRALAESKTGPCTLKAFRGHKVAEILACVENRRHLIEEIENFDRFDYGMHSLRIGREAELRGANVRPELINDITSHTTMGGRAPYSRAERLELVRANRLADRVVVKPLETAVRFESDRSAARADVFLSSEGDVLETSEARDRCSREQPDKRARTSGPIARDFFSPK